MKIEVEEQIERPVDVVFQFYADDHVRNHPRWDPYMELWMDSEAPIGVGTVIRRRNTRSETPVEGTMEVVEYERNKAIAMLTRLISNDSVRWGLPGGRPEQGEDWEQTLIREMFEEAGAEVLHARLLGFTRARCLTGSESGLVLVRSVWRASVRLLPWDPKFEIPFRRVVPAKEWVDHVWIDDVWKPIMIRAFEEAGLA